jgi:hypothetical protein
MKKTGYLRILRGVIMSLTLIVSLSVQAAETKWFLVANHNQYLPMSEVGMLVAADNESDFSVLGTTGNVLLSGVRIVTFEQLSTEGIIEVQQQSDNKLLRSIVQGELTLVGATGQVEIFSLSGVKKLEFKANGGETRLDVSSLQSGTYIVRCGKKAFKFIKK